MSARRATIGRPVELSGVGLHLGQPCLLVFRPAPCGSGRVFRRTDLPGTPRTAATADVAVFAERRTQLGTGEGALHTVEHVLAAVAALELDDVLIEMSAAEPPVLDGSAAGFVEALTEAGREEWQVPAPVIAPRTPLRMEDGRSWYEARPADTLTLSVGVDFPHPLIGRQTLDLAVTVDSFSSQIAGARTFGFVHEVAALQAQGLIQGASTHNAIVLDETGVVGNTLRWPDEFVRHKMLDLMGDLALSGARVRAHVTAERPSHSGTVRFVRELIGHAG